MKVVIVGGGSAGWMTAGWLCKKNSNLDITVIESPNIPKIGVGESVTPHVASFFLEMGIPTEHWMYATGSIYKFANKFVNWKTGQGEYEYFGFNYTTDSDLYYKDISHAVTKKDWLVNNDVGNKTTDLVLDLISRKDIDKFDKFFNSQYHYMEKNVSPFKNKQYLLNPLYSWSQHINADLAADYIRDHIAKPNGVKHIQEKITSVQSQEGSITSLVLESGEIITSDLYVDASGFHKLLVKQLAWKEKNYSDNPIDRAWVCQLDYEDQNSEMVNYTQSIAQNYGWLFKIGLYHRMGTGYCFSSQHISDDNALIEYRSMVKNLRREPRLIKWNPSRLEKMAEKNLVTVGLSCGFVEPMEANALFIIINSIGQLSSAIRNYSNTGVLDFRELNEKVSYSIDDIADFIKVHYTLSSRDQTDFWKDMREIHKKENHIDLIYEKYKSEKNVMTNAIDGYSLFPDYMWAQLAASWGISTKGWYTNPDNLTITLAKMHHLHQEQKHNLISQTSENNYNWLKENIFNSMTSNQWEELILK
jgi:tryptophan halogenase